MLSLVRPIIRHCVWYRLTAEGVLEKIQNLESGMACRGLGRSNRALKRPVPPLFTHALGKVRDRMLYASDLRQSPDNHGKTSGDRTGWKVPP